jgi:SARP family transcriptional regulator, regulator of embCAB operon
MSRIPTPAVKTAGKTAKAASVPEPISVRLTGGLVIRRGHTVLGARSLGGPKPRQVLEILLLRRGIPVSKDQLIELLWGGHPPAEPLPTLESHVSVLRRNLQPGHTKTGPLRTATGGYVMDRTLVTTDLDRFEALARAAEQAAADPAAGSSGAEEAYRLLTEALALTGEPLLGDELTCEWAETERALHATRVTAVTLAAAEAAAELGRCEEAVTFAQAALATDQLNERAWTALILALEAAGRHTEALQAYEKCRRTLHRELGCAPGPALRSAHARLLNATADADGELSDALSALLYLHEQLSHTDQHKSTPPPASVRAAGNILNKFLHKALAA